MWKFVSFTCKWKLIFICIDNAPINLKLQHSPTPGQTPGIWTFEDWIAVQIPAPSIQNGVQMPYRVVGFVCQMPRLKEQSSSAPVVMRLSNRNFNIPPGQTPGIWQFSAPEEWGIWFLRPSLGLVFVVCLGVVGKIEPEVSGFKLFFFRTLQSLTAINTCLD